MDEELLLKEIDSVYNNCTDWEKNFLVSISRNVMNKWSISEKQKEMLKNILIKNKKVISIKNDISNVSVDFLDMSPREWQKKAFKTWVANNYVGTVEAVTGTGKTFVGIMAIKILKTHDFLIVVPTLALQKQWNEELIKEGILQNDIGLINGSEKVVDKKYTIGVINSLRNLKFNCKSIILDEIHRYSGDINKKIFINNDFKILLGLSATPKLESRETHLAIDKCPIIFKYSHEDAKNDNVINDFNMINVGVELTSNERIEYNIADNDVKTYLKLFGNDFKCAVSLARHNSDASYLMKQVSRRKQIIQNCVNKSIKCVQLINELQKENNFKSIIFTELIETANTIKKQLESQKINSAIYHSGIKSKEKNKFFDDFRNGIFNIIISVRALDEGINIPDINNAIIVGGNSTTKQLIQRAGRVLRKVKGKTATIYQIYALNTKDEDWLNKRSKKINGSAESIKWL